jgi:hypothetical protein
MDVVCALVAKRKSAVLRKPGQPSAVEAERLPQTVGRWLREGADPQSPSG